MKRSEFAQQSVKKKSWHEPEFDIALHTGLRQGLQYALGWSMVNWEKRELNIPRKTWQGQTEDL
jgi:hypothetical protein